MRHASPRPAGMVLISPYAYPTPQSLRPNHTLLPRANLQEFLHHTLSLTLAAVVVCALRLVAAEARAAPRGRGGRGRELRSRSCSEILAMRPWLFCSQLQLIARNSWTTLGQDRTFRNPAQIFAVPCDHGLVSGLAAVQCEINYKKPNAWHNLYRKAVSCNSFQPVSTLGDSYNRLAPGHEPLQLE
eukprot:2483452-Rhodomonas_salina.1